MHGVRWLVLDCGYASTCRAADIAKFGDFSKEMDKVVRKNMDLAIGHADRMCGGFKREYHKIAEGFQQLGECFGKDSFGKDGIVGGRPTALCGVNPSAVPFFLGLTVWVFALHQQQSRRLGEAQHGGGAG